MNRILLFPARRSFLPRGSPALRFVALLTLLFFAIAVVWTSIISMGGTCLTTDSDVPQPRTAR